MVGNLKNWHALGGLLANSCKLHQDVSMSVKQEKAVMRSTDIC